MKLTTDMLEIEGVNSEFAGTIKKAFVETVNGSPELLAEFQSRLADCHVEFMNMILFGNITGGAVHEKQVTT